MFKNRKNFLEGVYITRTTLYRFKKARLSTYDINGEFKSCSEEQSKNEVKAEITATDDDFKEETQSVLSCINKDLSTSDAHMTSYENPLTTDSASFLHLESTPSDPSDADILDDIITKICEVKIECKDSPEDLLHPVDFNDLLHNKKFHEVVNQKSDKTAAEILLMILQISVKNMLSLTAISEILTMVNRLFPEPILPESKYMINKLLNSKECIEYHAICTRCNYYIGNFKTSEFCMHCKNCNEQVDVRNLCSLNFFVLIDPSSAIETVLNRYSDYYKNILQERSHENGYIRDIYDGKMYRKFLREIQDEKSPYITFNFNTDGAPCFESSQYSIWPIYLIINELPPQERLHNVITCGLWFGRQKPDLRVFLHQFVLMMNKLSSDGIHCTIKDELMIIKAYSLVCCVDSVARAPMQGIAQFNGKYGCSWCMHPGTYAEGSMRYDILDFYPEERDHYNMITFMEEVKDSKDSRYGVKYVSPLINLRYFDLVEGFVPEYMHFVAAGVCRQITENILESLNKKQIETINSILIQITAPTQLTRLSRRIDERNMWKAREYENWLLYYSIPILSLFVKQKYLKHLALLVDSMHVLMCTDISINELDNVDKMLHEFVVETETLYNKSTMTYNVHQLLHVTKSVLNWGPLWAHSAYAFESANCKLLRAIKSGKGVINQILRYLHVQRSLHFLESNVYFNCSYIIKHFSENTITGNIKRNFKLNTIRYFGSEFMIDDTILNKFYLIEDDIKAFLKMIKDGSLYTSYKKSNVRSCNSFAQLKDKTYVKMYAFLVDQRSKKEYTLFHVLETKSNKFSKKLETLFL